MRNKLWAISVFLVATNLSGCALALHEYQQLKNQEPLSVGQTPGYRAQIAVTPPWDVCDKPAFLEGVKRGYADTWNQKVSDRVGYFRLRASNRPGDTGAKKNLAIYQNKVISKNGLVRISDYPFKIDGQHYSCTSYSSFNAGMATGRTKASDDFDELKNSES